MIELAPLTLQNIPDCSRREPITVLQPASITTVRTIRAKFSLLGNELTDIFGVSGQFMLEA